LRFLCKKLFVKEIFNNSLLVYIYLQNGNK
jgi:hypothetical protein